MNEGSHSDSIVYVVDDDAPMRDALKELLESMGMRVDAFGSAAEFLKRASPISPVSWCSMSGCQV